jgi:probable HAF family extracellular repeat protein
MTRQQNIPRMLELVLAAGYLLHLSSAGFAASLTAIGVVPTEEQDPLVLVRDISEATSLSGDGTTVVGQLYDAPFRGAFRWTRSSGFTKIGDLWNTDASGRYSAVTAVSENGSVVVGSSSVDIQFEVQTPRGPFVMQGVESMRWTVGTGPVGMGDLIGGMHSSAAYAISAGGDVVVGVASDPTGGKPVRWTSTGEIEILDARVTMRASGVSADGRNVIGDFFPTSGPAVVWTDDGVIEIGDLPGGETGSIAFAISADGSTVVGYSAAAIGSMAYRWRRDTGIVALGSVSSVAWGVNADGSIVVGSSESSDTSSPAFIWTESQGMVSIRSLLESFNVNCAGWRFDKALGVSNDGRVIVGNGTLNNRKVAWIVDLSPIPEPAPGIPCLIGTFVALVRIRKPRQ